MKFYVRYFAGEFLLLMKGKIFRPGHFSESVGILVEQQVRGGRLLRGKKHQSGHFGNMNHIPVGVKDGYFLYVVILKADDIHFTDRIAILFHKVESIIFSGESLKGEKEVKREFPRDLMC